MTRRAIFLDIDGTYANHGVAPEGHVKAVRAARAAGHRVLLCTGRSRVMLSPALLAAGFDGIVGSAGAYVEVGGTVLADRRYPAPLAARAVSVLEDAGADFLLEAPDVLYGRPGLADRFRLAVARGRGVREEVARGQTDDILAGLRTSDDLHAVSFAKITVVTSPVPVPALGTRIGSQVAVLDSSIPEFGAASGEIYQAHITKALGMRIACESLGVPARDAVAFGDGRNDVEMLAYAGTGVAIRGADPALLAVADHVADGPETGGLAAAFAELGLV